MTNTSNKMIKIGIVGYGNLGKGVEMAISQNTDMELTAVFTRRSPESINSKATVYNLSEIENFKGLIDVMILCGGSSKDLPEQVIQISKHFHTVDSFDTHAKIPAYFDEVNRSSTENKTLSLISTGWDPGLFSMARLLGQCVLPQGEDYTFWGKGLSQGHSDAVRRVVGVKNGVQYTIPLEDALEQVRSGSNPKLETAEKHQRICYIVAEEGADIVEIETTIKTMPHYFAEYQTTVHFISEEELLKNHSKMPHGGIVFRSGTSASGSKQKIEFSLELESNPEFTSSVLVAYARAISKMSKEGQIGAKTVFDIPLGYLSPKSAEELRATLL
ncbi:diaminopimelate dehydrogenase [Myroides guanonis]|uniref:Meso-diaminopimelate D-dehydrogenase n=2 Tax=Myroides guanonis TaxID=1150112 RepID=A0A1I3KTM5_9FLAO|nr:diaminopimelate dehydrogenase [Myroides guanonis]